MFNNSSKILFLSMLVLGTLITVSSNSMISSWMGLEINLLSFIPLMTDNNLMSTEASLKYFLTQALASTVFLFSIIYFTLENYYSVNMSSMGSKTMILSALLLKSGAAPFHFWFPSVMQGLSWMNSLILMTWQKIAPFLLMSYILMSQIIMISSILSALIGAVGGLNQTSLPKLMAYSSINHLSWMMMSMLYSENLWFYYFMFYTFLSLTLILLFNMFNIFHINQLLNLPIKSKMIKFFNFMNLLSLGGLPPFLGFIPKLIVIQLISANAQMLMMTILIISTLITLFFYLRLCYTAFMLNSYEINWLMSLQHKKNLIIMYFIFSTFSITGIMLISSMYFML